MLTLIPRRVRRAHDVRRWRVQTPTEPAPRRLRVTWSDELTQETRGDLTTLLRVLIERTDIPHILIDMERCAYLSEEGVVALVAMDRYAGYRGGSVRVAVVGQPAAKLAGMGLGCLAA
jgi:hypothetical protein